MSEHKRSINSAGAATMTGYTIQIRVSQFLQHKPCAIEGVGMTEDWTNLPQKPVQFHLETERSDMLLYLHGLLPLVLAKSMQWGFLAKWQSQVPYLECRLQGHLLELKHTLTDLGVLRDSLAQGEPAFDPRSNVFDLPEVKP